MKSKISREVRVGLMVAVAIFLFYFGFNYLKGVSIFQSTNQYTGVFEELDGLVKSSPVKIKGFKVGQVSDIRFDFSKDEPFVVKIEVDNNISLPIGTEMLLTDDGLLGGKIIELVYSEDYADSGNHQKNDVLPTAVSKGLMDDLSASLIPKVENIALQADSLLSSIRKLIDNPLIEASLASIEKTSADLALTSAELKNLTGRQLPAILENVDGMTNDLKITTENIKNIDFAGTMQKADYTVKNLQDLTGKLNDNEGSLGLLMNDKELYIRLNNTVESADKLLIDLREHPKRYVNFSLFGGKGN